MICVYRGILMLNHRSLCYQAVMFMGHKKAVFLIFSWILKLQIATIRSNKTSWDLSHYIKYLKIKTTHIWRFYVDLKTRVLRSKKLLFPNALCWRKSTVFFKGALKAADMRGGSRWILQSIVSCSTLFPVTFKDFSESDSADSLLTARHTVCCRGNNSVM